MRNLKIGWAWIALIAVATVAMAQPSPEGPARPEGRRGQRQENERPRMDRTPFVPPLMAALDTDNDGTISAAEMEKASSALKKLDKNGDGNLSPDEMRPSPGGQPPRPDAGDRGRGGPRPPQSDTGMSIPEGPAMPKDQAEKKILDVLTEIHEGPRMMNVPPEDGRLLRLLDEAVGAKNVVEIGTSNGYSGIWQCLALRTTGGKLTTFEIDAQRAALARENFKKAGVDGIVTLVEGDAHQEIAKLKDPIDVLFLDADKEGYIDYLEKLLPLVKPGGLIIAHNMNQRQADPKYVKAITTNPALETLILHKEGTGVGVTLKKR